MNRFSPKQTLSNIATAVRETVDFMNKKSLAKFALIAIAAATASVGFVSATVGQTSVKMQTPQAAAQPGAIPGYPGFPGMGDPVAYGKWMKEQRDEARKRVQKECAEENVKTAAGKEACDDAQSDLEEYSQNRTARQDKNLAKCETFASKVEKDAAEAKDACNKAGFAGRVKECFTKVDSCHKQESEELADLELEDEPSTGDFCNKVLATKCPGLSVFNEGRDYRTEEREAKRDAKELKRDLDDLMKEKRESTLDLYKQRRELQEKQEDQAAAARKSERTIANNLKKALEGVKEQTTKAFESAQEAANQMEVEYIKMRKEARDAADVVQQAKDELQVMCRASAEKKYVEAEKVRQTALAARKKNIGASTNVSGSTKRTKAALARARQIDFVAYFNECSSGASADGVGGNNKIKTAERAKASADKLLDDKAAMIEKQRTQMFDKLKTMENEATNQRSKVVDEINDQLQDLSEDRDLVAKKNAARAAEFQQEQQTKDQNLQQRIESANKYLMEAQKDESVATSRLACLGAPGRRSESRKDRVEEGFGASIGAIQNTDQSCRTMTLVCTDAISKSLKPSICDDIAAGISKAKEKGARRAGTKDK